MQLFANFFEGQFNVPAIWWLGTLLWFGLLLLVNLYMNRRWRGNVSLKRAIISSAVWITLGLGLGVIIWANFGRVAGGKYFAGFFIEKALSIDNIFVWGLILSYLSIPKKYHYKILFWGIFGAILFRTLFIVGGLAIIDFFQPALIVLGILLLVSSYRLLVNSESQRFDPENSRIFRFVERRLPLTKKIDGSKFFVRNQSGHLVATLLFFTLCVVELTDILFAIDSVPASLAIVRDPYIVLASNIAAILGLRSLYFVFERLEDRFYLLNKGLALILGVIAVSLLLEPDNLFGLKWFGLDLPPILTVGFVGIVLGASILLSFLIPKPAQRRVRYGANHGRDE